MKKSIVTGIVALVVFGLGASASAVAASPSQLSVRSVQVSFADLNIYSDEGAQALYKRLQNASEKACSISNSGATKPVGAVDRSGNRSARPRVSSNHVAREADRVENTVQSALPRGIRPAGFDGFRACVAYVERAGCFHKRYSDREAAPGFGHAHYFGDTFAYFTGIARKLKTNACTHG